MSCYGEIPKIESEIRRLAERKRKLQSGDEPCEHSYDNSCNTWCYYCPDCGNYNGETGSKSRIPLKSEVMCHFCNEDL